MKKNALRDGFNYLDNYQEIKKNNFKRLLRRLDKPLFTFEESELLR